MKEIATQQQNNQKNNKNNLVPFDIVTFPDGQRFMMIPISRDIDVELRKYTIENPSVSKEDE